MFIPLTQWETCSVFSEVLTLHLKDVGQAAHCSVKISNKKRNIRKDPKLSEIIVIDYNIILLNQYSYVQHVNHKKPGLKK